MTTALALILLLRAIQSPAQVHDKEAIDLAKAAVVRTIDGTLPDKKFEDWLRDLFGPAAKIAWEVNDCGEQTGDPQLDRGRDFPMCVDAAVSLDSSRVLHLLLVVGSFKTGVRRQPPAFFYGCVLEAGAPSQWLKSLKEAANIRRPPERPLHP